MNTAPTRSNAPYGYALLATWVLFMILRVMVPLPHSVEWRILSTSLSVSLLSFGIYMITPPKTLRLSPSVKYIKYLGLVCAIVAIITLAAIPVIEVLRVLRFMD